MVLLFSGCSASGEAQTVEALREAMAQAQEIRFQCEIQAAYTDGVECFTLLCTQKEDEAMTFQVLAPEAIEGIQGTVDETDGTLRYDGAILGFPLLARQRLSPVSGPWVMLRALRSGCLTGWSREGEIYHLTLDDSYGDDPLTVDVWIREKTLLSGEISWRGQRQLSIQVEECVVQ